MTRNCDDEVRVGDLPIGAAVVSEVALELTEDEEAEERRALRDALARRIPAGFRAPAAKAPIEDT